MPFLRRRGNMVSEAGAQSNTGDSVSDENNAEGHTGAPILMSSPSSEPSIREHGQRRASEDKGATFPRHLSPETTVQESYKHRRFSVLRFRNASDSQLSLRAKQQAERPPPVPRPPAIITTAPTNDIAGPKKIHSGMNLASKFRRSNDVLRDDSGNRRNMSKMSRKLSTDGSGRPSLALMDEPRSPRPSTQSTAISNHTALTTFDNRQSESSRSDTSSPDRIHHSSPSTTPKQAVPSNSFFKLRRIKKAAEPFFPVAHLQQKKAGVIRTESSTSLRITPTPRPASAQSVITPRANADQDAHGLEPGTSAPVALVAHKAGPFSSHSSATQPNLPRGRSSTISSVTHQSTDSHLPPAVRISMSTGRKSFGDLFGLSRTRQTSELSRHGSLTPATPGSIASKSNSLHLPREPVILPERRKDESPAKYLARLEEVVRHGLIASALSKDSDPFSMAVLRSYMRGLSFFGDPMDMAIRKLLMETELPKETQQIDRCLQAFANRYHECNPGIYSSPDQAYFIAFSLLILHTDVFNKNNKHKMQKRDYLKNTRGEGIFDDILECFYDNISYTPFIHVEDDVDLTQERNITIKPRRKQFLSSTAGDAAKRTAKEPIDPYTLILDGNLDALRPSLKDAMHLDEHYNYLGTASCLNLKDLQKTFFRTGVLQIVSARSRPDAFMSEQTVTNPENAHPGIVDIKITKVGLLWRKDTKKRKARSPWQEWGAILTGAQLYFFRNTSWVKNLIHQYENHIKAGHDGIPIIFKPPLEEFKPDALISTHGAVALLDTTYKKHKNAFVYVRQGGLDEMLLADSEDELNDWLAKLNYAAAFRTSGVRMRGVIGGNYDGQGRRGIRRLDSFSSSQVVQSPTGPVSVARGKIDHKMAEDIQSARRDGIQYKIAEADRKVYDVQRQLEEQLRNARHLQILAPIQPRTREQLLLAAARTAAQLKWTRMEIWKEKCHRDILIQDLAEDWPPSASFVTPTKKQLESGSSASPITQPLASKPTSGNESGSETPIGPSLVRCSPMAKNNVGPDLMSKQPFPMPPNTATRQWGASGDPTDSASDVGSIRHGSHASTSPSPPQSTTSITTPAQRASSCVGTRMALPSTDSPSQDDVDADERDLLRQTGLWEARFGRELASKGLVSTSVDNAEHQTSSDRDVLDRTKIRRSLQRTLREGAGHLSHHRSRRGRELGPGGLPEESPRDTILSRGTGSFVVHGKKASVINLGTEIQSMSQDEKVIGRKQQQQMELRLATLVSNGEPHDDFHSAHEIPSHQTELNTGRRESAASAGTATARSFRELYRRYSTAQAARSVSAGGRLAVPSDGESEAVVSLSEGRQSPLLLESENEGIDAYDQETEESYQSQEMFVDRPREPGDESDEDSLPGPNHLLSRPVQVVNA
ncbi:hypothetical protein RJ55_10068 [Drechmeria coniospora]|nr:hypothetical protein RJ55_10068 [Drechmeria coniospora]